MTDNNQPIQNAEARENNAAKSGNRNQRNRHRPHNKAGNHPRPETAAQETKASETVEPAQKQQHNNGGKNNQGSRNHPKKNNNPNNKNRAQRPGRGNRHGAEGRPYDPYEAPSKEEIELSELRAKIVMKAADGSVPTVYGTQSEKKPTPTATPAAQTSAPEASSADTPMSPAPDTPAPVNENVKKVEVIGIRFRSAGKMYYFDPHGIKAKKGDSAIVETTRGPEFGDVCLGNSMVNADDTVAPLRPVLRIATPADIARNAENREKEKEALKVCQQKVREHGLEMKLIDVQYAFDGSKILFYFSADGRIDFRDLVRDLASVFRTRIELRQIGIRDEAKLLGGIGACGRSLCCATFLPDFAQVSIKMAKDQSLSLNSAKISGVCGRLMCCLRYEEDVYLEEIRKTPSNDTAVRTPDGVGTVIGSSPLAGTVRVILKDQPDTPPKQYHRDDVTVLSKERKSAQNNENNTEKGTKNN